MGTRIKAAILLCLMTAAAYSVHGAYRSMHRSTQNALPEELSARFASNEQAQYFLRDKEGYVAVYRDKRSRDLLSVTAIETGFLRDADRLLLNKGIPVKDAAELLGLLEDLGS